MPYWLNICLELVLFAVLKNVPFLTGQLPHDDGLVARGGEEHVGEDGRGGDLGDPAVVATECALACHLFARHFGFIIRD